MLLANWALFLCKNQIWLGLQISHKSIIKKYFKNQIFFAFLKLIGNSKNK